MKKKILVGSIIAVVVILITPLSSVVAKSSVDNNLVEIDVEFCGLGRKHTVKLTQQETDEVELLFDDIEQRLSEVETRDEAEEIFKDAVVELDRYGLFGRLSIEQVQNLVIRNSNSHRFNSQLEKIHSNPDMFIGGRNLFCLIAGETQNSFIIGPISILRTLLNIIFAQINYIIGTFFMNLGFPGDFFYDFEDFLIFLFQLLPNLDVGSIITMGEYYLTGFGLNDVPANGWVKTIGLMGIKEWSGSFYGRISYFPLALFGVLGFSGIKFGGNLVTSYSWYLGSALYVHLSDRPPIPW